MEQAGTPGTQLESLISSCMEKLAAVCDPRHVIRQFPCTVTGSVVTAGTLTVNSKGLAGHLRGCTQVYLFAATLGADADRLITQRSMADSAEALCIQACASAQIENYCNSIEQEPLSSIGSSGFYLRPRFSPGYSDFDIACQTDILNILQAHKRIGLTEINTHMLTPLKSVTALIGVSREKTFSEPVKCNLCDKTDCRQREVFA